MPWLRLDDRFDEHPKFVAAGPLGLALWVTGLAYCGRNLTDGFIPSGQVPRLVNWEEVGEGVTSRQVAARLVGAGLWEACEGGYQVHDYDHYQPSKAQVLEEREAARDRMHRRRSGEVPANNGRSSTSPYPVPETGYPDPDPDREPGPDPGPGRGRSPSTAAGGYDRKPGRRPKPTAADYARSSRGGVILTSYEREETRPDDSGA